MYTDVFYSNNDVILLPNIDICAFITMSLNVIYMKFSVITIIPHFIYIDHLKWKTTCTILKMAFFVLGYEIRIDCFSSKKSVAQHGRQNARTVQ